MALTFDTIAIDVGATSRTLIHSQFAALTPQAGDVLYLLVQNKRGSSSAPSVTGGPVLLADQVVGGTATPADNVGSIRLSVYKQTLTGGTFSVTVTPSGTGASCQVGAILARPGSGEVVTDDLLFVDCPTDAVLAGSVGSLDLITGDVLATCIGGTSQSGGLGTVTITASAATLASSTSFGNAATSTSGALEGGRWWGRTNTVTAHTSPDSGMSFTTGSSVMTGGGLFLRLRSAPPGPSINRSGETSGARPLPGQTVGAWATGGSSPAVPYPTGLAEGDTLYMVVHHRPATLDPGGTATADWDLVTSITGGGGTEGVGTGPTRISVLKRTVPAGGLTGVTDGSIVAGANATQAHIRVYRGQPGQVFDERWTSVSRDSASTSVGGTCATGLDLAAGDIVLAVAGLPDDTGPSLALSSLSASGSTFSALTRSPDTVVTSGTGNDAGVVAYEAAVTAGSSSTAPTVSGTTDVAETSVVALLRLRAGAPPAASDIDLSSWKLTLPTDGPDSGTTADEILQPELATYSDDNFFFNVDGDLIMIAPVQGATTGGSGGTRTELREMESGGLADWGLGDETPRQLTVSGIFDPTGSSDRKEMIVGQIHSGTGTPPLYLAVEFHVANPRLRVYKDGPGVGNPLTGLTTSTLITYRIRVGGGRVKLYCAIGDVAALPSTPQFDWLASDFAEVAARTGDCYLKAGAYNKSEAAHGGTGDVRAKITYLQLTQSGSVLVQIGQASDTSGARPLTATKSAPLAAATQTESARPLTAHTILGQACDTSSARALTVTKTMQLGRAGDTSSARELSSTGGIVVEDALNASVWAVDAGTGRLTPLPHLCKLSISEVANGVGKIALDYPYYGRGHELLAGNVTDDRDLEVEIRLTGTRAGALRGILTDTSGDDVAEDAIWTFEGTFLEVLLDEVLVWPQPGAEDQELIFSARNPGEMVATVLQQAQGRGCLAGVTRDFSTSADSTGAAWPTVASTKWSPGTTLLDMLGELVELGMIDGFELSAGRVLRMWAPDRRGADLTVGPNPLVFRRGRSIMQSPRRHTVREAGTSTLVAGGDGIYGDADDPTALARRGRRIERASSANGLSDTAAVSAYAQAYLQQVTPGQMEVTHSLVVGPGHPRPIAGFRRADWVWSDTRGQLERLRVQQVSLDIGADGRYDGDVVLGTALADRLVAVARRLKRISSGTEVVGTSAAPTGADDTTPPAAPVGITASSIADLDELGATIAVVLVGWTKVTANADGSATDDVAGYRVEWRLDLATAGWQLGRDQPGGDATGTSFGGVAGGTPIVVRVAAYDRNGNTSAYSAEVAITTESDTTPPPQPSAAVMSSRLGVLLATWDGLGSVGEPMPVDLDFVEVHISAAAVYEPDGSTYYDRLFAPGTMPIVDQPYGEARYIRLVAVDRTGNRSPASATASATPAKVVADDVFVGAIGSAQLADLAVTTAKINLLAVNNAQIGALDVGKLTTGTFSAAMTLTGIIRTGTSGLHWEGDTGGIRFYNSSGTMTIRLDGSSGNTLLTGTIQSALTGTRWTMEQDGTLRHYSSGFSGYSSVSSLNGDLIIRGRLDGNQRSGRINANSIGVGMNFSSDAEIPAQLRSEIVLFDRRTRMTAPYHEFQIDGRYSSPVGGAGSGRRIQFMALNASGAFIAKSGVSYFTDSSGNGGMAGNDTGWKLARNGSGDGRFMVTGGLLEGNGVGQALAWETTSSITVKDDVQDARAVLDPIATIRAARARKFRYRGQPADAPLRIGVIAEELPAVLQRDTIGPDGTTLPGIDLGSQIGVLWAAIGQLADLLEDHGVIPPAEGAT